mmetsp:Transcript_10906/g.16621  ORF Transcript_10906/g.16621 Transcript_10906/m.16621 type:complete len:700 (+) Transcript_10906:130-2229(+)
MTSKYYENGRLALKFNEDGTGFIYYPSGSVAVCSSEASSYQNRYYAFDSNRKNTLLLGIDEHAVGFCSSSKRKSMRDNAFEFALSKVGGIITNNEGRITQQWKWDRKAQNCGTPPNGDMVFRLNEHITFTFRSRSDMTLLFEYDSIKHEMDVGMKFKRNDSYLDHAKRGSAGRLIPQLNHVTLQQRTVDFNKEMAAKRNILYPRSENLSPMVQDIVGGLEKRFDEIGGTIKISHESANTWKTDALQMTLSEVPRIPVAGVETGVSPGFSQTIYVSAEDTSSLTKTAPAKLMTSDGEWKDSLSVRTVLREENPPLSRSSTVLKASGRYSSMLVVDPAAVTSDNPTGMIEIQGLPLQGVKWDVLKSSLAAAPASPNSPLTVVLVMRGGDPISCSYLRITELYNRSITEQGGTKRNTSSTTVSRAGSRPASGKATDQSIPQLYKIDVSENNRITKDLGIKSIPTFLMFNGKNLVYAGSVGGKKVKLDSTHKPQILLVESNVKHQIPAEKTLRRMGCDAFLCLGVSEAVNRVQQMTKPTPDASGRTADPVVFDIVLISEDVGAENISLLQKALSEFTKENRTVVAMLISVLGEYGRSNLNAANWESGCTSDVAAFMRPDLATLCSVAIQKPIKPMSIEKLLSMRVVPDADANFGLTPDSLRMKVNKVYNDVKSGQSKPIDYVGIRMSAHDTRMRGGIDLASSS